MSPMRPPSDKQESGILTGVQAVVHYAHASRGFFLRDTSMVHADLESGLGCWQDTGLLLKPKRLPSNSIMSNRIHTIWGQHEQAARSGNTSAVSMDGAGPWDWEQILCVYWESWALWLWEFCAPLMTGHKASLGLSTSLYLSSRAKSCLDAGAVHGTGFCAHPESHTDPLCSSCTCVDDACSHSGFIQGTDYFGMEEVRQFSQQLLWSTLPSAENRRDLHPQLGQHPDFCTTRKNCWSVLAPPSTRVWISTERTDTPVRKAYYKGKSHHDKWFHTYLRINIKIQETQRRKTAGLSQGNTILQH